MPEKIHALLGDLSSKSTAHLSGIKRVFLCAEDVKTDLTQMAHGILNSGESVESHLHPTMEEYFYFIKGRGKYTVGNKAFAIEEGSFIRIPMNVEHCLENIGDNPLEFIYFGIARD